MSHFTVLVIGDAPETQLRPYQENNMSDCPAELLTFNPIDVAADYDSRADALADGYKEHNGKVGYWENPDAKWDWYLLGGRWTGFFKMRAGTNGSTGEPGIMTDAAKAGYADQCRKGDVDLVGLQQEAADEAKARYETVLKYIGGPIVIPRSWKDVRDDESIGSIDARRAAYWAQPSLARLKEVQSKREGIPEKDRSLLTWLEAEQYACSLDDYVERARKGAMSTFAVIKDGKWFERVGMGWWGCVSDEKPDSEWTNEFWQLLEALPDDTLLSLYDCHI